MRNSITELVLDYVNLYNELLEDDEIEVGDTEWISKNKELSKLGNKISSKIKDSTSISIYYSDELPEPNKINNAYVKVVNDFDNLIYWVRELQHSIDDNEEDVVHHILCIEVTYSY